MPGVGARRFDHADGAGTAVSERAAPHHFAEFLNYASAGKGTPSHLIMELVKSMAGIDLVHIAYSGGVKQEMTRWARVVKDAGVRAD